MFLKFEFQDDRSINVGAVGVKVCLLPLTRLIAYTTACCYCKSRDIMSFLYNKSRSIKFSAVSVKSLSHYSSIARTTVKHRKPHMHGHR